MNANQAKKFFDALDAAGIKRYQCSTDLSTHLYNDGVRAIAKPDYKNEQIVAFRSVDYGGSVKRYDKNIQVVLSDFGDVHEVRAAGDYQQIVKFVESLGSISLNDDELKILLEIDKKNYDIIPETGDYNRFHYLSKKQYEALSKEDREKYDKEKAEYEEKKEKYIGQNSAASITL